MKKRKIAVAVVLYAIAYVVFNVVSICNYSREYSEKKSDVAIVLGAACSEKEVSEVYKQRLNHAIDLYEAKHISYIITTGGKGVDNYSGKFGKCKTNNGSKPL